MAEEDTPEFSIPERPVRRYPSRGGVEYEGETVFLLRPNGIEKPLGPLVKSVLESEPYRYGDWFDLPMPLYLVHDDDTGDTFRVAVREGVIELHVLPETGSEGLVAFYDRLRELTRTEWAVETRVE